MSCTRGTEMLWETRDLDPKIRIASASALPCAHWVNAAIQTLYI